MYSNHALVRMQQRGIPREIVQYLTRFGARAYDHRGARIRYFDHASRRRLIQEKGPASMRDMEKYLNAYAVEAVDGGVVTVGHLYKRVWRH